MQNRRVRIYYDDYSLEVRDRDSRLYGEFKFGEIRLFPFEMMLFDISDADTFLVRF